MVEEKIPQNTPEVITTLIVNGFHISKVQRFTNNTIYNLNKFDKLGAQVRYCILFSQETTETPLVDTLLTTAKNYNATPIVVCDFNITRRCQLYSTKDFFKMFVSFVNTGLILIPSLPEILNDLGFNKIPEGLHGRADELLEIYTKECLQFLLKSPSKRFGGDRLFESLPDGLVIAAQHFMILFDTKAYTIGYEFSSDDINRFSKYVEEFNARYASYFGPVFSFVVITGRFNDAHPSLNRRSEELYRQSNCRLTCISSKTLGLIVQLVKEKINVSQAILWKNIFSELTVDEETVGKEIKRIAKDNLL